MGRAFVKFQTERLSDKVRRSPVRGCMRVSSVKPLRSESLVRGRGRGLDRGASVGKATIR